VVGEVLSLYGPPEMLGVKDFTEKTRIGAEAVYSLRERREGLDKRSSISPE
jgi:hypothetical protein